LSILSTISTIVSGVPATLRVVIPLAAGGVLAGAIAIGASGPGGNGQSQQQVPPTLAATPVVEGDSSPTDAPSPNPTELAGIGTATPTPSSPTDQPPTHEEALALGQEATEAALGQGPDVYLFIATYRGRLSSYGFISPDGKFQVAVEGPQDDPARPRWEVKVQEFLPTPVGTLPRPLDLNRIRLDPREVRHMFSDRTGLAESDLFVQVQVDIETDAIVWNAGVVSPDALAKGDRGGPVLCQLSDVDGKWIKEVC
jgi:hypothetical protein